MLRQVDCPEVDWLLITVIGLTVITITPFAHVEVPHEGVPPGVTKQANEVVAVNVPDGVNVAVLKPVPCVDVHAVHEPVLVPPPGLLCEPA